MVAEAKHWIGTPYAHQASLRGVGCDCLGLVRGIWRALYGREPEPLRPYAPHWPFAVGDDRMLEAARRHLIEISVNEMQAGDVALFRWRAHLPASHAAILSSADRMIHAHDGAMVTEVALSSWWRRHCVAAFQFPAFTND
ncbi:MAG: NlpC/P60 family protein [Beijerinckiaceae bacterium]